MIVGDSEVNRLDGGVGNDDLDGMGGPDEAFGGEGSDECDGFATEHSCGPEAAPPGNGTFVILNQGLDGSSLIVQGDAAPTTSTSTSARRLDGDRKRSDRLPAKAAESRPRAA